MITPPLPQREDGWLIDGEGREFVAVCLDSSGAETPWPESPLLHIAGADEPFSPSSVDGAEALWTLTIGQIDGLIAAARSARGAITYRVTTGSGDTQRSHIAGTLATVPKGFGDKGRGISARVVVGPTGQGVLDPEPDTLPQRTATGAVKVAAAADDDDAVPLGQIDDAFAAKVADEDSATRAALSSTYETLGRADLLSTLVQAAAAKLTATKRALASGGLFTYATLGDSITEGRGATSRANRWATLIGQALATRGGVPLAEYLPVFYQTPTTLPQPAAVTGAPVANNNYGPGGRSYDLTTADTVTWTVNGSCVDVLYAGLTTGGTLSVSVDGGAATTVSTATAANIDGQVLPIDFGAAGAHTVAVTASAGTVRVTGLIIYPDTRTAGIRHIDAGHNGWASHHFSGGGAGGTSLQEWVRTLSPSLVVIALGANDAANTPATFKTNLLSIITKVRASGHSPDFLLLATSERSDWGGAADWDQYRDAMRQIAEADDAIAYTDMTSLVGAVADVPALFADTVHPANAGHAAMADNLLRTVHTTQALPRAASEAIWVPSDRFISVSGSPAIGTNSATYVYMAFDQTTQEGTVAWVEIPDSWKSADLVLYHVGVSGASGVVSWRVQIAAQQVGAVASANASDVTKNITMAATAYTLQQDTFGQRVTLTPGALHKIGVIRMAASGSDTFNGDAGLVGISIRRAS